MSSGRTTKETFEKQLNEALIRINTLIKSTSAKSELTKRIDALRQSLSHLTGHGDDLTYAKLAYGTNQLLQDINDERALELIEMKINLQDKSVQQKLADKIDSTRKVILHFNPQMETITNARQELKSLEEALELAKFEYKTSQMLQNSNHSTKIASANSKPSRFGLFACLFPWCCPADDDQENEKRPLLKS